MLPGAAQSEPFHCPSCGSFYAMVVHPADSRQVDSAICEVCGDVMKSWNGYRLFTFILIKESQR
jgi:transposase-like protein